MELNLETFGDVMNALITQSNVKMLIELPEGTQVPKLTATGIGTVDFYILLAAIPSVFRDMVDEMGGKENITDAGKMIDAMLDMVKADMLEAIA